MLKKFEVENFKNFKNKFIFDLSETKSFEFNQECVENDIVKKAVIYGKNACGKTNLGYAIFDIQNHVNINKIDDFYQNSYLNMESSEKFATFKYTFEFDKQIVEYSYKKSSADTLYFEEFKVDNKVCFFIDKTQSDIAEINFEGTENLKKNLENSNISLVNYIMNNTVWEESDNFMRTFIQFFFYVQEEMLHINRILECIPKTSKEFCDFLSGENKLKEFKDFINEKGIVCDLAIEDGLDGKKLYFKFPNGKMLSFNENASTGTLSLTKQFLKWNIFNDHLEKNYKRIIDVFKVKPFIFIDEFDAYYHFELAKDYVKHLKEVDAQMIITTHNTGIMTNDLFRPDCLFVMKSDSIKPTFKLTNKDLRKAHNMEKLYKGNFFDE